MLCEPALTAIVEVLIDLEGSLRARSKRRVNALQSILSSCDCGRLVATLLESRDVLQLDMS
jgi:hypothetical protein